MYFVQDIWFLYRIYFLVDSCVWCTKIGMFHIKSINSFLCYFSEFFPGEYFSVCLKQLYFFLSLFAFIALVFNFHSLSNELITLYSDSYFSTYCKIWIKQKDPSHLKLKKNLTWKNYDKIIWWNGSTKQSSQNTMPHTVLHLFLQVQCLFLYGYW